MNGVRSGDVAVAIASVLAAWIGARSSTTSTPNASASLVIVEAVTFVRPLSTRRYSRSDMPSARDAISACVHPRASRRRRTFTATRSNVPAYPPDRCRAPRFVPRDATHARSATGF